MNISSKNTLESRRLINSFFIDLHYKITAGKMEIIVITNFLTHTMHFCQHFSLHFFKVNVITIQILCLRKWNTKILHIIFKIITTKWQSQNPNLQAHFRIQEFTEFMFFLNGFSFIDSIKRQREGDRKGENINRLPFVCISVGDWTHTPGICPDWGSNLWPGNFLFCRTTINQLRHTGQHQNSWSWQTCCNASRYNKIVLSSYKALKNHLKRNKIIIYFMEGRNKT